MKTICTFFLSGLIPLIAFGQITISGTVKDKKELIIGANVFLKDTYDGASTDLDGNFEFSTFEEGKYVLTVSYVGYETWEDTLHIQEEDIHLDVVLTSSSNELNEVVITAGSFEAGDEKKAVVLNSIDIAMTAGATADISGALNTLPGTQTVGETGQLFVRGGSAAETRTFIDGMFVEKPYGSSVPNVPARGRFSPFLFKGTMFSTGGYSAEYGQAMSSALILNTQDLPTESMTSVSLMSVGGNLAHTKLWDKTSVTLSGGYMNLAPYTSVFKQNMEWHKPFQGLDGQLVFRHKTSDTGMLKFFGNVNRSWFALAYPDQKDVLQTNRLDLENENVYLNTSYKEILNDKWTFFAGMAFTYDNDDIREQFKVKIKGKSGQAKIRLSNQISDQVNLKFGVEYLHSDFRERFTSADAQKLSSDIVENYSAGFVETDVYLSRRLVARLGTRLEYSGILQRWNTAPRTSLAYKTGEKSQVSFAYGQFFQNPENELLRYNTDLNFEKADHYMLNYQVMKDNRIFRVEGYYKDYKNLVKFDPATPWESTNLGDGYAKGIDFFFRDRETLKRGDYWVSYSFLDTERDYRAFPNTSTPNFASRHNLSVVYKHWLPKLSTAIGLTYSFSSGRPYHNPNLDGFNQSISKPFQDLSFVASKLTNVFGNFTVFYLSINNVPGFKNNFGYQFSSIPNPEGVYTSRAIQPTAKRFFFLGVFMSIGQKFDQEATVKPPE